MADRIAVMSEGRVLQVGTPAEVYDRPRSRFVSEFLGTSNIFEGRLSDGSGRTVNIDLDMGGASSRIVLTADGVHDPNLRVFVAVRPERIRIETKPAAGGGGACVPVRVIDRVFRGSSLAYKLAVEGRSEPIISYRQAGDGASLEPGAGAFACWSDDAPVLLEDRP